jgi:hypothetical protein
MHGAAHRYTPMHEHAANILRFPFKRFLRQAACIATKIKA